MSEVTVSDHVPHNDMTELANQGARAIPDGLQRIVLVTDPTTGASGVALVGYGTEHDTEAEARRDVITQAVVDMLTHLRAIASSIGLKIDVADPRDLN